MDRLLDTPEEEVLPGIFISDFRQQHKQENKDATQHTVELKDKPIDDITLEDADNLIQKHFLTLQQDMSPEDHQMALILENIRELENSIDKLLESNQLLEREYEMDPDDIYVESIQENMIVIQDKERQLAEFNAQLEGVRLEEQGGDLDEIEAGDDEGIWL
eukprot:TRINITY_DN7957_c0_g1_i1.p1 TRINITY_DN7957_c0_g1~~TRINITY_DN7957_c0_g1_i1.p1  ORF type:complete len:175 (-),score=58.60 TRINITY_DN7957_c0_g1_i1:184-666(-)